MAVNGWADVQALNFTDVKKECDFVVFREDLISEVNHLSADTKLISIKEGDDVVRLGEVSSKRPFIPYSEALDWVSEQLEKTGLPYKLRISTIEKKSRALYQEYVFDSLIEAPDHESISPVLYLRSCYAGSRPALELFTGTYRYVCSNGALVKEGSESIIRVNILNWNDAGKVRISDQFKNAFNNNLTQAISQRYLKMGNIGLADTYRRLFTADGHLPLGLRKGVLKNLEANGDVIIHAETTKKREPPQRAVLLQEQDLTENNINAAIEIVRDVSLWDVYNHFTNLATFQSVHSSTFITKSRHIDTAFSQLAA